MPPCGYDSPAMRILFATMQFGRGYSQGTERYLSILAAGLGERGHEAIVLAGDPEGRDARDGQAVRRLGERIADEPLTLACPTHTWMAVEGTPAAEFVGLLRELRPDVLHVA